MINNYIYENARVLNEFKQLVLENKQPQLAIYRNKYFVVSNYKGSFCDKLKHLFHQFLQSIGIISREPEKIRTLINEVSDLHVNFTQNIISERVRQFELRIQELTAQMDQNSGVVQTMRNEIQELSSQKNVASTAKEEAENQLALIREQ
ncbi:MAG: hypothetical protein LW832_06695, partial [Parachlamydia sp.]|nr:hypothetical protein [Parachlamydia sp.]